MVGKCDVGKTEDSGKLSLESDGLETCSREKDVAPKFSLEGWESETPRCKINPRAANQTNHGPGLSDSQF